jgi:HlyD family secretion protein
MDIVRERPRSLRRTVVVLAIAVALAMTTLTLRRLRAAAPAVDRATLWLDTVRRGPMVCDIRGQGSLVPEEVRWLTARSPARVERLLVKAGTFVQASTALIELSSADLELAALEAERLLTQGEAALATRQAALDAAKLSEESVIASLRWDLAGAERRAQANDGLAEQGYVSQLDRGQTRDRASELSTRLAFEEKRLATQSLGSRAELAAERAKIANLRAIAAFRRKELDELTVRSGVTGVIEELPLTSGQAVVAGTMLAKVVQPERLMAEVRIAETQAKDVKVGQHASVDTRNGVISGHVSRIDPGSQGGTVRIDVALDGDLPPGARPDLAVEALIEVGRLPDALFVGRPALATPDSTVALFKLEEDGMTAVRIAVDLGKSSAHAIEIKAHLRENDRVVLSDMSQWDRVDRIRIR